MQIELPWSPEERENLAHLQNLRNFVAHRNGRLMDLPADKERDIKTLVSKMPGVSIEDSSLVVSAGYIESAATLVFVLVGRLNQKLADRYAYAVFQSPGT